MAADEKWYFTKEQLANTPSRRCGIDADKELSYRQQAANFIQDMGQRLSVTQLCINTAIVYMHRFYVFHSLSQFHRNAIATAALFLAAKVEEQPRKLEHVIKVAHACLHKDQPQPDVRSEQYLEQAQDVVFNENVLLQTLGFDVAIDHPHTHVVRCCHLVKASKDLAQASYFMASNSLHMTTMCLQYKPTVVACFCIHLACKWSNWEIPQSNEGKHWFWYVDRSVTAELLQQLTAEFLHIFDNCPSRLKRRIKSISAKQSPSLNHPSLSNSPFDTEPRQVSPAADGGPTFQSSRPFPLEETKKQAGQSSSSSSTTTATTTTSSRPPVDYREYREKRERERIEREKSSSSITNPAGTSADPGSMAKSHNSHSHQAKQQTSHASTSSSKHPGGIQGVAKPVSHHNHHRNTETKPSGQQQPSQRHSSSSSVNATTGQNQRARVNRDYNAGNTIYQTKEATTTSLVVNDSTIIGDNTTLNTPHDDNHGLGEKSLTNNSRLVDVKHDKVQQRGYDPRQKIIEHGAKDTEQKNYAKYQQDQQQQQRGRKINDSVEQRSEEVRKIIEKPLPVPKASLRPEITSQKDDYVSGMMKQSHNPKYQQQQTSEKQSSSSSSSSAASAAAPSVVNISRNPQDYGSVSGSTREKASSALSKNSQLQQQQQQQQHANIATITVKKFDNKSNVKNGNSQLINTIDEAKMDKRMRHQLDEETRLQGVGLNQQTSNVQNPVPSLPVKQHKSLFSPEKVTNQRESHTRVSRSSRQKTSPSTGNTSIISNIVNTSVTKISKPHDRVPDQMGNIEHVGNFETSQIAHQAHVNHQNVMHHHHHHHPQQQQQQHHHQHHHHQSQTQNSQESTSLSVKSTSHSKRHRTSGIVDSVKQQQSIKTESQTRMEVPIKLEQTLKMEQSIKIDTPIKIESSIKLESSIKPEIDDNRENYESMKMLGRVPDLLQPIRDGQTSTNGRSIVGINSTSSLSILNDIKLSENTRNFENEAISTRHHAMTNGLEPNITTKRDEVARDSQDSGYSGSLMSRSSQDYLSPMKSAQSISALLQEPLAPMPSLLQGIDDYVTHQTSSSSQQSTLHVNQDNAQTSSQRTYNYTENQENAIVSRDNRQHSVNMTYQQSSIDTSNLTRDNDVLSTVDTTILSVPQQTIPEANENLPNHQIINVSQQLTNNQQNIVSSVLNDDTTTVSLNSVNLTNATLTGTSMASVSLTTTSITTTATTTAMTTTAVAATTTTTATTRKSGHHKSDKKKKKDKHKHKEKDKDKSRDKKKTKHKDKEKEKHIKITIPKDKLNLSTDTVAALTSQTQSGNTTIIIGHDKKNLQSSTTGLKIKIPKERLKVNSETTSQSLVQAPLKIKIRTTVGENSESTISMSTSSSRKRERAGIETPVDTAINAPPSKKQHQHHHSQGTTTTTTTLGGTTTITSGMTTGPNQQILLQQQQQQGITSYVQQPGQRQNGRHYSSNNKVRGGLGARQYNDIASHRAPSRSSSSTYDSTAISSSSGNNVQYENYHQREGLQRSMIQESVVCRQREKQHCEIEPRSSDPSMRVVNNVADNFSNSPIIHTSSSNVFANISAPSVVASTVNPDNFKMSNFSRNLVNRRINVNRTLARLSGDNKNPYARISGGRGDGGGCLVVGGGGGAMTMSQDPSSYYFANYPPPTMYNHPPGGYTMYDHAMYYRQFQQQQYAIAAAAAAAAAAAGLSIYPTGNVIITPDGAIDTSVPPPILPSGHINRVTNGNILNSIVDNPPPLPSEPPPNSSPPPPPPPPE